MIVFAAYIIDIMDATTTNLEEVMIKIESLTKEGSTTGGRRKKVMTEKNFSYEFKAHLKK